MHEVLALPLRIALLVGVAVAAHLAVAFVQRAVRRATAARVRLSKLRTFVTLVGSVLVFGIYFVALGLILREIGVSLTAYLASASILGLAIGFGSQGLVQDVVTGLTVVFSDAYDVGDLVEISGQTGIVEFVGLRFTTLVNFAGARVFVPNRTVTNVVNYESGFVRVFLDVRLPADPDLAARMEAAVRRVAESAGEQFAGTLMVAPTFEGRHTTSTGDAYVRVRFRVWPGQRAIVDGPIRAQVLAALREIDPQVGDWRVAVHYRAELAAPIPARRLPRPAALEHYGEI